MWRQESSVALTSDRSPGTECAQLEPPRTALRRFPRRGATRTRLVSTNPANVWSQARPHPVRSLALQSTEVLGTNGSSEHFNKRTIRCIDAADPCSEQSQKGTFLRPGA